MTRIEEAKDIANRMYYTNGNVDSETSKKCSIIAIDFHVSKLKEIEFNYDIDLGVEIRYHESLKQEIEKL